MTMAPDPHPPHPVRPFDAEPPAYRRYPVAEPLSIRPPGLWRRFWGAVRRLLAHLRPAAAWTATAVVEGFALVFGLLAIAIASLLLFGDPASINAWGLWLQGILEAVR
jgi:hypothetical protein